MSRLPRTRTRARSRNLHTAEETALHPDLLARVRAASPFPPSSSSARRRLEEETLAGLAALRAKGQRPPATVWQRANPRRPHGQ